MRFSDDEYYIEDLSPTHQRCLKLRGRIYSESSELQRIEVVDTHDYGRALILDGAIQATERDTFIYHEVLTSAAAHAGGAGRRAGDRWWGWRDPGRAAQASERQESSGR
jgi:spermidine synthase